MRGRLVRVSARLLVSLGVALTVTQCSSSGNARPVVPTTSLVVTYGAQPTASAQMVCGTEGQAAVNAAFNMTGLVVTTPTWVDHLYGCTYQYPSGSFDLSVKELPTIAATVDYFTSLKAKFTGAQPLALGQDGFTSADGTSVVRKDNKVLVVDVAKLPAHFGSPSQTRTVASQDIAVTLLGCWTGD
ncbi:MAG TPA: hypothetical protein VHN36_17040 [Ilumatobacteraceae bacterium]|nr:hypothetical protein [Ilumatobacteraceae bacterium]